MFKKNKLIFFLAFVFLVSLILLSWNKNYFFPAKNLDQINKNNQIEKTEIDLEFSFDKDAVLRLKYPYSAEEKLSAFQITEKIASEQNWQFVSKDYGEMGVLITQIKDKTNGDDNKYWQYYINDVLAPIAADKYILQANDKLSWRFEPSIY